MGEAERPLLDLSLERLWELEELEPAGDGGSWFAEALGELALADLERVEELLVRGGLLERVELGALNILDQGQLEDLRLGDLLDLDRDLFEADQPCGAEAALSGDELVAT